MFRNEEINHKQMELPIKKEKERKKEGVRVEHEVICIKLVLSTITLSEPPPLSPRLHKSFWISWK